MKSKELSGVIVPLFTPLNENESVDLAALKKLINYVISGGVQGIFSLGTSSEFARLTPEERYQIMETTVTETRHRVPVLIGISDTGLQRVVENLKIAEQIGADAVVASPPYYYPITSDDEIVAFYSELAAHSSLPIFLYNIPATCRTGISLAALKKLALFYNIVALKDSSGNWEYLSSVITEFKSRPDFKIFVGEETLSYQGLAAGAHGLVPSSANVFPRLFVTLYQAIWQGDYPKALELSNQIFEMNKINSYSSSWMSKIAWRKAALSQLAICNERATQPYIPVNDMVRKDISKLVEQYSKNFGV